MNVYAQLVHKQTSKLLGVIADSPPLATEAGLDLGRRIIRYVLAPSNDRTGSPV